MPRIDETYHEDLGPVGPDGRCHFAYRYHLTRFTDADGTALVARSYVEDPTAAHFLRLEPTRPIVASDFRCPLFIEAVRHLRGHGKTALTWLSHEAQGYMPVPEDI